MSAFIHNDEVYSRLLKSITDRPDYIRYSGYNGTALELVTKIREWNYKSVNYRYKENTEVPAFVPARLAPYTFVETFKILESIDYQSCEVDAWGESPEYAALQLLQLAAARKIIHGTAAYENAPW